MGCLLRTQIPGLLPESDLLVGTSTLVILNHNTIWDSLTISKNSVPVCPKERFPRFSPVYFSNLIPTHPPKATWSSISSLTVLLLSVPITCGLLHRAFPSILLCPPYPWAESTTPAYMHICVMAPNILFPACVSVFLLFWPMSCLRTEKRASWSLHFSGLGWCGKVLNRWFSEWTRGPVGAVTRRQARCEREALNPAEWEW